MIAGIQSQYAPTMYVGLWSRVAGFRREDLNEALERRRVVQGTLMRATIHLVSADDYWPLALAIRVPRRRWWLRMASNRGREGSVEAAADRARRALADHGRLGRQQLEAVVGRGMIEPLGLWLDLVRVPPSGTWERRRADLFAAAEDWLGPPPPELTEADARDLLVRRYLSGFGPATAAQVAGWAGTTVADLAPSIERVATRRFLGPDGKALLDLPGAALPCATGEVPVRFLSTWEAVLLVHARQAEVLREEDRSRIFTSRNPHSQNTFLVGGQVAGTWHYEQDQVEIDPFRPLPRGQVRAVHEEGERLAELYREI